MNLSLTFSRRLWLLVLLFILGGVLSGGFGQLLSYLPVDAEAAVKIAMVVQQLLLFLLPAVLCALMITRRPAEFLQIKSRPTWKMLLMSLTTLIFSLPAMNCIIEAFEHVPWPAYVVEMEKTAQESVALILGHGTVAMILGVCIMAILPGMCEELFFRGALQNLLRSKPMSVHFAIWIAALVFSFLHFQPVGFVPRMLLGAGFGYFAVWTGSLWTAIACHMLNNTLSVIMMQAGMDTDIIGLSTPVLSVASLVLTVIGLRVIYSKSMSKGM